MKVVYVDIYALIRDAVDDAALTGRKISHIELSPGEISELQYQLHRSHFIGYSGSLPPKVMSDGFLCTLFGVDLYKTNYEKESENNNPPRK